jgi:hypothetical protein
VGLKSTKNEIPTTKVFKTINKVVLTENEIGEILQKRTEESVLVATISGFSLDRDPSVRVYFDFLEVKKHKSSSLFEQFVVDLMKAHSLAMVKFGHSAVCLDNRNGFAAKILWDEHVGIMIHVDGYSTEVEK